MTALIPTIRTLGLDVSLRRTGWAILNYKTGALEHQGIIATDPGDSLIERLASIRSQTLKLLDDCDNGVDVAMETGVAYRSGEVTRKLAMVWGVVALAAWGRLGVEPHLVNVSEVKTLATGVGNASKEQVTAAAVTRWGPSADDSDIADACWIADHCRRRMHKLYPSEEGEQG